VRLQVEGILNKQQLPLSDLLALYSHGDKEVYVSRELQAVNALAESLGFIYLTYTMVANSFG
jgi:hypothetical protein